MEHNHVVTHTVFWQV